MEEPQVHQSELACQLLGESGQGNMASVRALVGHLAPLGQLCSHSRTSEGHARAATTQAL